MNAVACSTPLGGDGHNTKLEKPSLEVVPTTLRLVLLIYSFQFRSAFLPPNRRPPASLHCCLPGFPNFAFTTEKGTFSSSDLELSPTSLTDESDLDRAKMNHRAKCLPQRLFTSKVMVRTHRQTDRHTDRHTADRLLNTATKCSVITTCHCQLMKTTFEV